MIDWDRVEYLASNGNPSADRRIEKTREEWKAQLSEEAYRITRLSGTERAFSSEMCTAFELGLYACVCCETQLFDSTEKFDSGTGWPSFNMPIKENVIAYKHDHSLSRSRVEVLCNVCDAHLGHVFPDGPRPTGLRYCINALALVKLQ